MSKQLSAHAAWAELSDGLYLAKGRCPATIAKHLDQCLGKPAQVLDAGCGTGAVLAAWPREIDRTGFDRDSGLVEHAALASFDMNDWDPHGHGGNGGGKHLKAIGCDQGDVRSQLGKALGKAQLCTPSRGGHVHIAVSAQAGNSMPDFVAFGFNFSNGRAVVMVYHRGRGHQDGFQF